MKKEVILHVGLHKTGSTSIQLNCWRYSEQLLSAGIYYPKFSSDNWENHSVPLSLIFQDNPRAKNHTVNNDYNSDASAMAAALQMRLFLINELKKTIANTVLFSAEDVSNFSFEDIIKFKLLLAECGDFDFKVIIYVRHPVKFILSNAQELVRAGEKSLSHIFELGNIQNSEIKIKNLQRIFGPECIKVYSFDEVVKDFGDVTRHFFKLINCSHIETDQVMANSATSIEKILVLSAVNSLGVKYVSLLNENLPDKGAKLSIDANIEKYLWLSCSGDVDFLKINFNITFDKKTIVASQNLTLNLNILYLNVMDSCRLLSLNGINISSLGIFERLIRDTIVYLPEFSSLISVMAYNLHNISIFKNYILYFSAKNLLVGEFINSLYIVSDDILNSCNFNSEKYLLDNPDVVSSGIDPFRHYYVHGRFEGRFGSFYNE